MNGLVRRPLFIFPDVFDVIQKDSLENERKEGCNECRKDSQILLENEQKTQVCPVDPLRLPSRLSCRAAYITAPSTSLIRATSMDLRLSRNISDRHE